MAISASALFLREDDGFRPTSLSAGPWSPEALHGGPPASLLARTLERFSQPEGYDPADFQVARVTVELLRPVPFERLDVSARVRRPGRNVQLVEASLWAEEKEVARATGLRIRRGRAPGIPGRAVGSPSAVGRPEEGTAPPEPTGPFHPGFHSEGVEHRFIQGSFAEPGPAVDWIRVRVPLLEDEPLSPLCRTCAVADFGNGISGMLPGTHTYINPDLTVYLHRYPEGEWICLDAVTRVEPHGIALATSTMHDRQGPFGCAAQSLIVSERP